jgi:hypothetical protein
MPEPKLRGWTLRFRARDPSDCGHPVRLAPPAVDTMLEHMNFRGYEDARGVHFPMRDGQKMVRVFVTRAALEGQKADLAEGGFLPRFEAFRRIYEDVARSKYQTGAVKTAIRVNLEDVNKFLEERKP